MDKNWECQSPENIPLCFIYLFRHLTFPILFFLEERGFISWFTTPEEQTHVGILFVVGKRGSRHKSVSFCYSDISKNNGCAFWNFSIALCSKNINIHTVYNSKYRVSEEEWTKLRESVPYVKLYRYNPKHLYPMLNGHGDNGQRSLKVWQLLHTYWLPNSY